MSSKVRLIVRDILKLNGNHGLLKKFLIKVSSCDVLGKQRHLTEPVLTFRPSAIDPCSSKLKGYSSFVGLRHFSQEKRRLPIIYLFTKEGCTLCDEAKLLLEPYNHRFILEEVDITLPENEPWYEMYKYDIPVFHIFEDFLFKHRVDLDVLETALKEFEKKSDIT